jgi:hypothetical protein
MLAGLCLIIKLEQFLNLLEKNFLNICICIFHKKIYDNFMKKIRP